MKRFSLMRAALVVALTLTLIGRGAPASAQAMMVFDPASYAKNVLNEIHLTQQNLDMAIQVKTSLDALTNLKTFTAGQWSDARNNLLALQQIVAQNKDLSYNDSNLAEVFHKAYPDYHTPANFGSLSKTWYANTKSAILNALQVAGLTTKQFGKTDEILSDAQLRTENPKSQSELVQAGNRIAGVTAEQLQKLQQLEVARQGYETTYYAEQEQTKTAEAPVIANWLSSAAPKPMPTGIVPH